jgi:hypothetical protein
MKPQIAGFNMLSKQFSFPVRQSEFTQLTLFSKSAVRLSADIESILCQFLLTIRAFCPVFGILVKSFQLLNDLI